jgi:hypothetical protein
MITAAAATRRVKRACASVPHSVRGSARSCDTPSGVMKQSHD